MMMSHNCFRCQCLLSTAFYWHVLLWIISFPHHLYGFPWDQIFSLYVHIKFHVFTKVEVLPKSTCTEFTHFRQQPPYLVSKGLRYFLSHFSGLLLDLHSTLLQVSFLQRGCPKGELSPITFLSKLGAITIITIRDSLTHGSRAKSSANWVQH